MGFQPIANRGAVGCLQRMHAAAWRIRSVERNRCVQATAAWELQDAAAGWIGSEGACEREDADWACTSSAGKSVDWVVATMAEGLIRVNARSVVVSVARVERWVFDVR